MIEPSSSQQFQHFPQGKLEVPTSLYALDQVLEWFDQFKQPWLSDAFWMLCKTSLAEGFTNAVRYAHRNVPNASIHLEIKFLEHQIEIRILDEGPPFNLAQKLAELQKRNDPLALGGRGLIIMNTISDHLSYTRLPDDRNCLLMVKSYPPETSLTEGNSPSSKESPDQ